MFFQIEIADAKDTLVLRDVFCMDNVTVLTETVTGIMENLGFDPKLKEGIEVKISSERGVHQLLYFEDMRRASEFKDATYNYLIENESSETEK